MQSPTTDTNVKNLNAGKMVWRLFPKEAPITVENMKKMVREGHYNNSHLYRAQKQFCLQGGLWNLRKAPFDPIPLEYKYVPPSYPLYLDDQHPKISFSTFKC